MNFELLGPKSKTAVAVIASVVANSMYFAGNGCIIAKQTERNVTNAGIIGAVVGVVVGVGIARWDMMPLNNVPREVTKDVVKRLLAAPLLGTSAMLAVYYLLKMLMADDKRLESQKDPNSPKIHAAGSVIIGLVLFSAGRVK